VRLLLLLLRRGGRQQALDRTRRGVAVVCTSEGTHSLVTDTCCALLEEHPPRRLGTRAGKHQEAHSIMVFTDSQLC
jgi:hypothetical protein